MAAVVVDLSGVAILRFGVMEDLFVDSSGVLVALSGVTSSSLRVGVAVAVTRVAAKVVRSKVAEEERAARSLARVLAGDRRGGVVRECFILPVWASHPGRRLLFNGVMVGVVGMVSDLLQIGKKK
jgi:hypothetical protein